MNIAFKKHSLALTLDKNGTQAQNNNYSFMEYGRIHIATIV